jgi:hypothetical protein
MSALNGCIVIVLADGDGFIVVVVVVVVGGIHDPLLVQDVDNGVTDTNNVLTTIEFIFAQ